MDKLGQEEVNRIIDAICEQGNAEEVSIWVWLNICCDCKYKKEETK